MSFKHSLIGKSYRNILRPYLFKLDPENAHDAFTNFGAFLGKSQLAKTLTKNLFDYQNEALSQKVAGINFHNPVGLSAGFDKESRNRKFVSLGIPGYAVRDFEEPEKQKLFTDCTNTIVSDDLEEILKEIEALHLTVKASVAGHESGVELADQIAEKLNLFHNDIKLSTARRDKGEMRKVLKESNLTCPDFMTCTTLQQVFDFSDAHNFPLMMKTPKGAGTSQVRTKGQLFAGRPLRTTFNAQPVATVWEMFLSEWLECTQAGSFRYDLLGYSVGSNSTVAIGDGRVQALTFF